MNIFNNGAKLVSGSPVPTGRGGEFWGMKNQYKCPVYCVIWGGQKNYQCHGTDGLVSLAPLYI